MVKTDFEKLNFCLEFLKKNKFDVIINLSAITDIDFCEKNKKIAKNVNFKIVKNICESIKKNKLDTFLIHLSTDQFYYKFKKNNEELKTYKNFYCKTKLLSEFECLKINSAILRTNFIGKSLKKNRLSFYKRWRKCMLVNEYSW